MAQYDVFELSDGGLVVDVQSDLLGPLLTRVVVPLLPLEQAPEPARRLNPVFRFEEGSYMMASQYLSAVHMSELGACVANLKPQAGMITDALDMVFHGF